MKKTIILLATVLLAACSSKNINNLKLNVDKPADVEAKFGKPDTIVRNVFMGMSAEFWAYRKDSICLAFRNDILAEVQDHCFNGFRPTNDEIEKIEADAKRMADSISEVLSAQIEAGLNSK